MDKPYTYLENIPVLGEEIPQDSIISRTIYEDDQVKAILFNFAPHQELSEHTASVPAVVHFLDGEARVVLGEDELDARPGTWIHMPAKQPHSIVARTHLTMLLYLLEGGRE